MAELARLIRSTTENNTLIESDLDPHQLAYLKARQERHTESYQMLTRAVVLGMPTGVYSNRGIEKLVRIHFGHGISFVSVRKDLRCNDAQVKVCQSAVRTTMAEIRKSLVGALELMGATR